MVHLSEFHTSIQYYKGEGRDASSATSLCAIKCNIHISGMFVNVVDCMKESSRNDTDKGEYICSNKLCHHRFRIVVVRFLYLCI